MPYFNLLSTFNYANESQNPPKLLLLWRIHNLYASVQLYSMYYNYTIYIYSVSMNFVSIKVNMKVNSNTYNIR